MKRAWLPKGVQPLVCFSRHSQGPPTASAPSYCVLQNKRGHGQQISQFPKLKPEETEQDGPLLPYFIGDKPQAQSLMLRGD